MENLKWRVHSQFNQFFLHIRNQVKFKRKGYGERPQKKNLFDQEQSYLEDSYPLDVYKSFLNEYNYNKNLLTLHYLDLFFSDKINFLLSKKNIRVLEPGCQDFSRLSAFRAFFKKNNIPYFIRGLELDAFPILSDLHSRWDKAQYYISLDQDQSVFMAEDFFKAKYTADLIFCFYPFVSGYPALRWGVPDSNGNCELWIKSFLNNLTHEGLLLVVHQGDAEEKVFDQFRLELQSPLKLIQREQVQLNFFKTKHPGFASLYQKIN